MSSIYHSNWTSIALNSTEKREIEMKNAFSIASLIKLCRLLKIILIECFPHNAEHKRPNYTDHIAIPYCCFTIYLLVYFSLLKFDR